MNGTLYLLPVPLGDIPPENVIPAFVLKLLNSIDHYAVEEIKPARRYLKRAGIRKTFDDLHFYTLNEHTEEPELLPMLRVLKSGFDLGIMSEAGVPAVADPGARLVDMAHRNEIKVVPLSGPSSILMALMASGLNGQNFHFHGYLPVRKTQRIHMLKKMERQAGESGDTQIFMETPYRNRSLLEDILKICNEKTLICLATDITLEREFIKTRTVREWRKKIPDIHKRPVIFLLGSGSI